MTHTMKNLLQGLSVATLFAMGACAGPQPAGSAPNFEDGDLNHPISVEPSYKSLKLNFAPSGLSTTDAAQLRAFVRDYSAHGNGSIAVNAPVNADQHGAGQWFADQINALGVSRDHILVTSHDAPANNMQAEINFVAYQARLAACGDWSENLSVTFENSTARNFGCAVQQNIAAMVADPRDLMAPRPMDAMDANRRATVLDHYEKGDTTQASKTDEQKAPGSTVGQ